MTVTDKDAKELQKMIDKLEKQSKKDKEKEKKKQLDKPKKKLYINNMANKDITLQQLKEQKKELNEKLEHYEFNGPSEKVQKLEDELFEINDTIKKLG